MHSVYSAQCIVHSVYSAQCTVHVPAKGSKPDPDRYYMHQTPDSRKKSSRVEEWQSVLWLLALDTFSEGDSFHLVRRPGRPWWALVGLVGLGGPPTLHRTTFLFLLSFQPS